ncbi:MAG: hypothetical protein KC478_09140 [Bacteriovoracaceae bacterium]|nr:hypothetical protein [Bacteriovoracaceae bacterium]
MKKIIILLLIAPILAAAIFLWQRYSSNVVSVAPYPYVFQNDSYKDIEPEAPILIIGDRLGHRFGSFAQIMAKKVSTNLTKPIKIQSIAEKGEGLHRTLQKVKSLKRLPLIMIYLGSSEESYESRFHTQDIPTIKKNLAIYNDDRTKTLLMIYPELSRFLYFPVNYKKLPEIPKLDEQDYSPIVIQKRNEITFKLFEQEIDELMSYAKDRNSYFIALSTPLNLDAKPRSSCPGSFDPQLKPKLDQVIELVKKKDFKQAYSISRELSLLAQSNARILFIHGKVAKALGKFKEAQKHLELAAAFDCSNWRGSPVYNSILKASAQRHDAAYFDFNEMLKRHWSDNIVFLDDIYPQNLYMEKTANAIADRIKKLLKL